MASFDFEAFSGRPAPDQSTDTTVGTDPIEATVAPAAAAPPPVNKEFDFDAFSGSTAPETPGVAEPFREITDPLGRPLINQPPPRQWSALATALPGTAAAAQNLTIHPASRAVLQNFDLTSDVSANSAALKKIVRGVYGPTYNLNRAAPIPVDDLSDDQLSKIIEEPRVLRALQLDSVTRRRLAEDAEEAAILRGDIPIMLAAEGAVNTMMRMMAPPETRTPEAIVAQQNRGFLTGFTNALERGITTLKYGLLISFAQSLKARAGYARGDAWQTFSDVFDEKVFGAEGTAQRDITLIPNPIDLLIGAGAGASAILDVYRSGGYNEKAAAALEQQAYAQLKDAFERLNRARARLPQSRVTEGFMRKYNELPNNFIDAAPGFLQLIVENPLAFSAASTEILAEQAPVLAASAAATAVGGPIAGITVSTLGTFFSEKFNVDDQRTKFIKEKTGIDLNTTEGQAAFLNNLDAQRLFNNYGTKRGLVIAGGQLATLGYFRGGTFIKSMSLTGMMAERTLVSGTMDGLFEAAAGLVTIGKVNVKEALAEAVFGMNPISVGVDLYVAGAGDIKRRNDARKATAWLQGVTELKGQIAGIDVVKLDTAASVLGEKLADEGIETAYIVASELERFDQDGNVAQTLGLDRADVRRAAAEGDFVEVTASAFVRHILGKDGFDALIEHTAFDLNGMTPNEAAKYEADGIGDQIEQQIEERARARLAPGLDDASLSKLAADMGSIQDQVAAQLEATGKYDTNKSRLFGMLTAQRYATRAIRRTEETGQPVDARALFDEDNLQITGRARVQPTGTLEQTVFHGTPYRFAPEPGFPHGRPRLDKMGSGEGAQMYGRGFYSAEAESLGLQYRDAVSGDRRVYELDGQQMPISIDPEKLAQDFNVTEGEASELAEIIDTLRNQPVGADLSLDGVIKKLTSELDSLSESTDEISALLKGSYERSLALANKYKDRIKVSAGTLYKLDLPDADAANLLDYDAPISSQPKVVQDAITKLGFMPDNPDKMAGGDVWFRMRQQLGEQEAVDAMRSAGVPGLRYKDARSRGKDDGTRNFVVWDQDVLDRMALLERNGEALDAISEASQGAVDAGRASVQPTGTLEQKGGFEAYRKLVDPEGRTIPAEDRPNLRMGDMYGMLPKDAEVVGELDDVILHRGPNGDYYATAYNADLGEQDVVGYIQGRENGTELAVVEEMQGKGIGSELQYLFRRENPLAPTGGLTEAGARRLESTYDRLAAEYMDPLEQQVSLFQDSLLEESGDHPRRIATRQPTQDTGEDKPTIGLDTIRDDVVYMAKMRAAIDSYPNFRADENETDGESVERYIEEVKRNLLWLHDTYGDEYRERGSQWYDGARRITEAWMQRYGIEDNQIAGVLAALSPQMDWFTNVSLGERVIDTFLYGQDISWDTEMQATMDRIFPEVITDKNGDPVLDKKGNVKGYADLRAQIEGKTLAELGDGTPEGDYFQAAWIRVYDETNNSRWYTGITPEGGLTESPTNANGSKKARRWGGLRDISKAVSILRDPSPENISASLGSQHKVRNFYNNILAPNNPHGDVTIDTHAVAAAQLRPLGGSALAVSQNLSGPPKSAPLGAVGTYAIHAEAYRRAAEERGVLARQMQSITWEAVRTLFTDTFKTKANISKIDAVWQEYTDGTITEDEARNQIETLAGGVGAPFWADIRPGDTSDAADGNATYAGKLSVAERGEEALRPGRAGDLGRPELEQQAAGQQAARGAFTPSDLITDQEGNPVNLLQIFEKADPTTFLHESGHFWLEQLKADALAVGGQFDRDWNVVKNWWASRPLELREEAVRRAKKAKDKDAVAALQKMSEAQVAAYAREGNLRGEGMQRYLSVAMHEQFARGVEDYFATGRAPSLSLASLFSAFRVWVSSVYSKLAGAKLDVKFSPEVTAVIDRMLAADEEISLIEGQYNLAAMYTTAEQAGMTPTQFAAYQKQVAEAKDERRARQLSKHIKELKRERTKWWKEAREGFREEASQQVASEPAYRLLYALTNQGLADGSTLADDERVDRMDRALLKELLEAEGFSLDDMPKVDGKVVYEDTGVSPAVVAAAFGYEDVDAMILDLVGRQPYKQSVEEAIDALMEEEHGSLESAGEAEALASAYSEKTGRVLAAELEAMRTSEPAFKQKFVRAYARDRLLNTPTAEVRPFRFLAAEGRHAKLAGEALKRGDKVEAYRHQFQRLVNHYMAAEALKAQSDVEKKTRYMRGFLKKGKKFGGIEADYVDNIMRILAAVNFGQGSAGQQSRLAEINALQDFIEERQKADGSILDVPAWLLDTTGNTANSAREMSYLRFLQLHETIKRYEKQGRAANKIRVGAEDQESAVVKAELLAALAGRDVAAVNRLRGKAVSAEGVLYGAASVIAQVDAQLLKVEALMEAIDGKPLGVWHQAIYEPFSQAAAQKYDLQAEVSQLIGELIEALPKEVRRNFGKRVDVGALGRPGMKMTRGNLIMLALNVGNESNLDKLIRGMGGDAETKVKGAGWNINEQLIDTALEQLTQEEWNLVQAIWQHAEKLYPAVEAIYRREHGISPDRVEPRTIKTKFGDIKGGYFPMMYDRTIAGVATDLSQKTAMELMQAEVGRATVNSSMTKARTGYAAPVDLDISRLALGMDNTIHFITHYEAVRNANKILGDKDVRAELEQKIGPAYADQIVKWVAALASNGNDSPPVDIIQKGMQSLYNNTTVAVLGFSYSTLAMQTLGLINGQDRLLADTNYGPVSIAAVQKDIAAGVAAAAKPQHVQFVMQVSGEMRSRRKSMDREVAQVLKNLSGKEGKVSAAQRFSMEAIAQVQFYTVDIPVWTAAYNRALKAEPGDTDKAVKYADRVVRLSQSAGGLKDLAAIQRHKGIVKGLTMFYSFFSALYAVLRGTGVEFSENVRSKPIAATTRAATRLFVLLALQSVATGLVRGELPDWEPENEDEEGMLKYIVKESVATALGTLPVVRDVAAGWASGYGYNGGAGTIAFEAASKSLKGMEKIINEMGEEEVVAREADYEALARKYAPFVLLGGSLTGLPAVQVNRTLDGLGAYYDDADDWNWTDLVRGYDAKRAARRE